MNIRIGIPQTNSRKSEPTMLPKTPKSNMDISSSQINASLEINQKAEITDSQKRLKMSMAPTQHLDMISDSEEPTKISLVIPPRKFNKKERPKNQQLIKKRLTRQKQPDTNNLASTTPKMLRKKNNHGFTKLNLREEPDIMDPELDISVPEVEVGISPSPVKIKLKENNLNRLEKDRVNLAPIKLTVHPPPNRVPENHRRQRKSITEFSASQKKLLNQIAKTVKETISKRIKAAAKLKRIGKMLSTKAKQNQGDSKAKRKKMVRVGWCRLAYRYILNMFLMWLTTYIGVQVQVSDWEPLIKSIIFDFFKAFFTVGLFHFITITIENQRNVEYSIKERRMIEKRNQIRYFLPTSFLIFTGLCFLCCLLVITGGDYRKRYQYLTFFQVYILWVVWIICFFLLKIFGQHTPKTVEQIYEESLDPRIREARDNFEDYHKDSNYRNRYLESLKGQITAQNKHLKPKAVELHRKIIDEIQYEYIKKPIYNNPDVIEAGNRLLSTLKPNKNAPKVEPPTAAPTEQKLDLSMDKSPQAIISAMKVDKRSVGNDPNKLTVFDFDVKRLGSPSPQNKHRPGLRQGSKSLGGSVANTPSLSRKKRKNKFSLTTKLSMAFTGEVIEGAVKGSGSSAFLSTIIGINKNGENNSDKNLRKQITFTQFMRGALFILFPLVQHTIYAILQVEYNRISSETLLALLFTVFFSLPFIFSNILNKMNKLYKFQHSMYIILSLETIQFLHLNVLYRVPTALNEDLRFPEFVFYVLFMMMIFLTRMVFNVPSIRLWLFLRKPPERKKLGEETPEDQEFKVRQYVKKLIALNFGLSFVFIYIFTSFNMLGAILILHRMGFIEKMFYMNITQTESISYFLILFFFMVALFIVNGNWIRRNVKDVNIDESSVIFLNHNYSMYSFLALWFLVEYIKVT